MSIVASEQVSAVPDFCEVVIVGGGVIGLACAEALSARGIDVCVIERDLVGRAASWAGGGMLTPLPPDQCPDAIRSLLEESLRLYPDWCARLRAESGIDPEYWVCGAEYLKNGQTIAYPQMAQVRNPRLLRALVAVLRKRGVPLIEHTEVIGWDCNIESNRLRAVRTARGTISCCAAVLAAGAWSAPLGAEGIKPAKGQMLLLDAPPGALMQLLIGESVYLIPRRDGQILVGSTVEDVGFNLDTTMEAREVLLGRAARLWPPVRHYPVLRQWAGLRPQAASDAPLLDAHPGIPGLYRATGHFRVGLTLAPASAARLAGMILSATSASRSPARAFHSG